MEDKQSNQQENLYDLKIIHKMISEISHEIRNPLGTSITAITHLNKETSKMITAHDTSTMTKAQFEDFLINTKETSDIIFENLNRAIDLVQSFKRITAQQAVDEKKKMNIFTALQDIQRTISPRLQKMNIELSIVGDNTLEIITYPGILIQIINNLIINSLTHAFEIGDSGKIKISFNVTDNDLNILYTDNGKGISSEIQKHIFNEFYTTGSDKGGTGLGMHIIHTLVTERLNGCITLNSNVNQGISFTITFPVE